VPLLCLSRFRASVLNHFPKHSDSESYCTLARLCGIEWLSAISMAAFLPSLTSEVFTMAEIGDRCPSHLDLSYFNYKAWCERLGYPAATYGAWLRLERCGAPKGVGIILQTRAQQAAWKREHKAELEAGRHTLAAQREKEIPGTC
jgi:hypothetical protein